MAATQCYLKQENYITGILDELVQEVKLNGTLLSRLKSQTEGIIHYLKGASSVEEFLQIFKKGTSSLSTYLNLMVEINCKLELLISQEVKEWECMTTFYSNRANGEGMCILKTEIDHKLSDSKVQHYQKPLTIDFHVESDPLNCFQVGRKTESNKIVEYNAKEYSAEFQDSCIENLNSHSDGEVSEPNKLCSEVENITDSSNYHLKPEKDLARQREAVKKVKKLNVYDEPPAEYEGFIEHVISASELYVYLGTEEAYLMNECDEELDSLCEQYRELNQNLKSDSSGLQLKEKSNLNNLDLYALYYSEEESKLYRAEIEEWDTNIIKDNEAVVFLFDFGIRKIVPIDSLYPMPEELKRFPAFAVRCHLKFENDNKEPAPSESTLLIKWVEEHTEVNIRICERDEKQETSLPVIISDISSNEVLNDILLKERKTLRRDESYNNWDPMKAEYESSLNNYDLDIYDPATAIYGYVGKDYSRVCKQYGETGRCFKGMSCKKEHIRLDSRGFTTDKEEVYISAFKPLATPNIDDELFVRLTNINTSTSFYCIQENATTESETLNTLVSYMNQNVMEMKKLSTAPGVGQIVIAKASEDGLWYRAKALEVIPELEECTLFFVDYGRTETVGFSSVRAIEPRYLHLPFQAMFCEIFGVGDKSETANEGVQYLKNLTEGVKIKVVSVLPSVRPHLVVRLYHDDKDVGKVLLKMKIAVPKTNILINDSFYVPG